MEFDSKVASAQSMSWINDTSLAEGIVLTPVANQPEEIISKEKDSVHTLSDFIHSLFVSGVPSEVIQGWLGQVDFASDMSIVDNFKIFSTNFKK